MTEKAPVRCRLLDHLFVPCKVAIVGVIADVYRCQICGYVPGFGGMALAPIKAVAVDPNEERETAPQAHTGGKD